jgi:DNA-binding response OmpR family regulator
MEEKGVVLIIEDDSRSAELIADVLQYEGYEPQVCRTAGDGLKGLLNRPAAILLDWVLPDHSGLELCLALRARDEQVPIIFVSGRTDEGSVVKGLDAGGNDFIFKPFRAGELIARLHAQIRISRRVTNDPPPGAAVARDSAAAAGSR